MWGSGKHGGNAGDEVGEEDFFAHLESLEPALELHRFNECGANTQDDEGCTASCKDAELLADLLELRDNNSAAVAAVADAVRPPDLQKERPRKLLQKERPRKLPRESGEHDDKVMWLPSMYTRLGQLGARASTGARYDEDVRVAAAGWAQAVPAAATCAKFGSRRLPVVAQLVPQIAPQTPPKDASQAAPPLASGLPFVTFSDLRATKLAPKFGPAPKEQVLRVANALAHNNLTGHSYTVREIAREYHCVSGGDRQRAVHYASLVQKFWWQSRGKDRAPPNKQSAGGEDKSAGKGASEPALDTETDDSVLLIPPHTVNTHEHRHSPSSLPPSPPEGHSFPAAKRPSRGRCLPVGSLVWLALNLVYLVYLRTVHLRLTAAAAAADPALATLLSSQPSDQPSGPSPADWMGGRTALGVDFGHCPSGWLADISRPGESARCFGATRAFGTHHECATSLCPASVPPGVQANATLATIESSRQNRFIFETLARGKDLWMGWYSNDEASAGWSRGRWVNGRGAAHDAGPVPFTPFTHWRAGQPDAKFGREDCAYLSGTTGEWEDYACDLREFRCLCELGLDADAPYYDAMRAHDDAQLAESKQRRVWAALVVGAALILPLTSTGHSLRSRPHVLPATSASRAHDPLRLARLRPSLLGASEDPEVSWVRCAMACLSSAMFFCGFSPFLCHYLGGVWTVLQLGQWPSYAPLAGLGGFMMLESLPASLQRKAAAGQGVFYTVIVLVCARRAFEHARDPQSEALGTPKMLMFFGFALLNGLAASTVFRQAMRGSATPHELYCTSSQCGRLLAGTAGQLLVLCFFVPVANDPDMAAHHPYSAGVALTAGCWMALAGCWSRQCSVMLLGDASNEIMLRRDDPSNEIMLRRDDASNEIMLRRDDPSDSYETSSGPHPYPYFCTEAWRRERTRKTGDEGASAAGDGAQSRAKDSEVEGHALPIETKSLE